MVQADGPEDMRADRAMRVVPLALGLEVQDIDSELAGAGRLGERDQPLDPLESAAMEALEQRGLRNVQGHRKHRR